VTPYLTETLRPSRFSFRLIHQTSPTSDEKTFKNHFFGLHPLKTTRTTPPVSADASRQPYVFLNGAITHAGFRRNTATDLAYHERQLIHSNKRHPTLTSQTPPIKYKTHPKSRQAIDQQRIGCTGFDHIKADAQGYAAIAPSSRHSLFFFAAVPVGLGLGRISLGDLGVNAQALFAGGELWIRELCC